MDAGTIPFEAHLDSSDILIIGRSKILGSEHRDALNQDFQARIFLFLLCLSAIRMRLMMLTWQY